VLVGSFKKGRTFHRKGEPRLELPPTATEPPHGFEVHAIAGSPVPYSSANTICSSNGFLTACHVAYSLHYTLRLKPDDVWMAILSSVAAHIDANIKDLRTGFVDFEGKSELTVLVPPAYEALADAAMPWGDVVGMFSSLVGEHTKGDVRAAFEPTFSTTDAVSRVNAGIVLMAAFKSVFTYSMKTMCGIREVVLEGTPEDWEALRTKAAALRGLAGGRLGASVPRWFALIDGTLSQLEATAKGAPSADFWRRIYSRTLPRGSGTTTTFSGWALDFFLYDVEGGRIDHERMHRDEEKERA
jgi:hypothetical protein